MSPETASPVDFSLNHKSRYNECVGAAPGNGNVVNATGRKARMGHVIREALDAVVSPNVRDDVLKEALKRSKLDEIPEEVHLLARFVIEGLGPSMRASVGFDEADSVLSSLHGILSLARQDEMTTSTAAVDTWEEANTNKYTPALAQEHELRTGPAEPITEPAEAEASIETVIERAKARFPNAQIRLTESDAPSRATLRAPEKPLPLVIFASRNAEHTALLTNLLMGQATVAAVTDAQQFDQAFRLHKVRDPIVVLDCAHAIDSSRQLGVILGSHVSAGTNVVVWGPPPDFEREVTVAKALQREWIRCAKEATLEDVVSLCVMLAG